MIHQIKEDSRSLLKLKPRLHFYFDSMADFQSLPTLETVAPGSDALCVDTGVTFILRGDTGLWHAQTSSQGSINPASVTVYDKTFTNATFNGDVNTIAVKLTDTVTMVSFWGFAQQNATGTMGQDFQILAPVDYPLLERFIGQVDQMSYGYNSNVGNFSYSPIRITADRGMEIVTAPNIAVGTRFSFQFVLILTE